MTREIVTRAPHREVGIVNAGWLLDHPVQHESHLERRFIMAALSCPVVCDIQHQPLTLQLHDPDSTSSTRYTPDFLVTFRDGSSVIVEVKPKARLKPHERRLQAAGQLLQEQGQRFFVATDKHIDGNGLAMRAMLVMRYGRMHLSAEAALETLTAIRNACRDSVSVKELVEQGLSEAMVWALVARHECRVPPDFQVEPNQSITIIPYEGDCHDYFLSWFGASLG